MRVGESWRKLTSRVACDCFDLSTRTAILLLQMAAQYKYGRIGRGTPDFLSGIAKKSITFSQLYAVLRT